MEFPTETRTEIRQGSAPGEYSLTVVFREVKEGPGVYFVAECLEIPGCVSQGSTRQEAKENIEDAMRACLSVVFEDSLKQLMSHPGIPDLRGISSQERLTVDPTPHLQYS